MNRTLKSAIQILKTSPAADIEAMTIATSTASNEAKVQRLRAYLELGPGVKVTIIKNGRKRGFKIEGKEKAGSIEESLSYERTNC